MKYWILYTLKRRNNSRLSSLKIKQQNESPYIQITNKVRNNNSCLEFLNIWLNGCYRSFLSLYNQSHIITINSIKNNTNRCHILDITPVMLTAHLFFNNSFYILFCQIWTIILFIIPIDYPSLKKKNNTPFYS